MLIANNFSYRNKIQLKQRKINENNRLDNLDIEPILKKIYLQRGVKNSCELNRNINNLINYNDLSDINKATNLLSKAIKNKKKIIVVGDFDVDGATSTALVILALRKFGTCKDQIDFIIPNRFKEGYGLSPKIVIQAENKGAQFILTVDNGISSNEGVLLANRKNIPVLITDHHIPNLILPQAEAIVNPYINSDTSFALRSLSGVGVAFYLMLALRNKMKKEKWFKKNNISFPNLADLLDLVAFGTIADSVPLNKNNRILVYQGLKRMRSSNCRPGIVALAEISKCNLSWIDTKDLSFSLGPRLNAAGRLNNMSVGVLLLLTNNLNKARFLAMKLDSLNLIRRKIAKNMEKEALKFCHNLIIKENSIPYGFIIYNNSWHQGIIGILASRIKEKFNRPVCVFASSEEGIIKGSIRSINGLHIYNFIKKINLSFPNLILSFGGHAAAAGITIKKKKLDIFSCIFYQFIYEELKSRILDKITLWTDGQLSVNELTINTAILIHKGGPWGESFPYPSFNGYFKILKKTILNNKHIKLILLPLLEGSFPLEGIAFNIDVEFWKTQNIKNVEILYNLEINWFKEKKKLQLVIQHIRLI